MCKKHLLFPFHGDKNKQELLVVLAPHTANGVWNQSFDLPISELKYLEGNCPLLWPVNA